jgi:hypothetical protein
LVTSYGTQVTGTLGPVYEGGNGVTNPRAAIEEMCTTTWSKLTLLQADCFERSISYPPPIEQCDCCTFCHPTLYQKEQMGLQR